jgi:hypothetical protein
LIGSVAREFVAGLISASGYQDHTASPSASHALVRRSENVHRIPQPTCRDDRDTPLVGARDARRSASDLPDGESGKFSQARVDFANG